jgi:hypothetical protein
MEPEFYLNLVSNAPSLGFILWLVWRMNNHTIPRLVADFKEGIDKQRSDYKEISLIARADFLSQLAEQRSSFKDQLERERELNRRQVEQFFATICKSNHKEE